MDSNNPLPSNYREPIPPIVSALYMYLHPDIDKSATLESFKEGENTIRLKQVNLVWLFLLQLGVGWVTYMVSRNRLLPFLSWILVVFYFIRFGNNFDVLYTEIPAATLIVLSTLFLLRAFEKETNSSYLIAGIVLGLLVLTKAVFFYLLPVIILLLYLVKKREKGVMNFAILAAGSLLIISPWIIRNLILLDDFGVTHRGGGALYNRALENKMKQDEIIGAVYLWGPELYRVLVEGSFLSADSTDYQSGGKYEPIVRFPESSQDSMAFEMIRPSMAVSYHSKFRIEMDSLGFAFRESGMNREKARSEALGTLKTKAMHIILDNPLDHIKMTPLFFWRGIWSFPNSTIPLIGNKLQSIVNNIMNLVAYLSIFFLFFYGLIKRNIGLLALTIIPISMLLFQGAISHNLPRYSEPAIPSMLISLTVLGWMIGNKFDIKNRSFLYLRNLKVNFGGYR